MRHLTTTGQVNQDWQGPWQEEVRRYGEDAVQEALLQLLAKGLSPADLLQEVFGDPTSDGRRRLRRIAKCRAIDEHRKRDALRRRMTRVATGLTYEPDQTKADLAIDVAEGLGLLEASQRESITLSYGFESRALGQEEIATRLRVTTRTIRKRAEHGGKHLKFHLGGAYR